MPETSREQGVPKEARLQRDFLDWMFPESGLEGSQQNLSSEMDLLMVLSRRQGHFPRSLGDTTRPSSSALNLGSFVSIILSFPALTCGLLEPQNLYKIAIDQHGRKGDLLVRRALQLDLCLN